PALARALLGHLLDHAADAEDLRLADDVDDARALVRAAGLAADGALVPELVGARRRLHDEAIDLRRLVEAALLRVAEARAEHLRHRRRRVELRDRADDPHDLRLGLLLLDHLPLGELELGEDL